MVGTIEAGKLLNISDRRVRYLLADNRVEGAFKVGRIWIIPLVNGMPIVKTFNKGPVPTWKQLKKKALSRIHINKHLFGKQDSNGQYVPVVIVKKPGGKPIYCHRVEIHGYLSVIYDYENPFENARVWIETDSEPKIVGESYTYAEIKKMLEVVG
jgi:hypothetical protein